LRKVNRPKKILLDVVSWQEELEAMAREACKEHWAWIQEERIKQPNSSKWPQYTPVVRNWKGSVSITWQQSGWISQQGQSNKKLISRHVAPTKKGYIESVFKKASAEELARILELEEKLAKIRADLRLAGKIRGTILMGLSKRKDGDSSEEGESVWNQ
jgi:hypothetical protein